MQGNEQSPSLTRQLNKYWIPNVDIHKKIITTQIQSYLGPNSTARSFTKNGTEGFLIATPGECLTDDQIDDICKKSLEMYKTQAEARMISADRIRDLLRPLHIPVVIYKNRNNTGGGGSGSGSGSSRNNVFIGDDDREIGRFMWSNNWNSSSIGRWNSYNHGSISGGDVSASSGSNNMRYGSHNHYYRNESYGQPSSFEPLLSSETSAMPASSLAPEGESIMAFSNQRGYYCQGYGDPRY